MNEPLLIVDQMVKHFSTSGVFSKAGEKVRAVDDISFSIPKGGIFALVGESGCGKTTMARLIMRLIDPDSGKIYFDGKDALALKGKELHEMRRNIQMIFQDPYGSLNPRWRVRDIIAEPLKAHGYANAQEREEMILTMLKTVGLQREHINRYPHEFSGGQRQRIGIARALITKPKLVICDEPISALDVSIQAQTINLLKDLQQEFNLTYLFITHDLRMVRYLCDEVAVMYLGKIVEQGMRKEMFDSPKHPYTKALFSAIPMPDPALEKKEIILEGDLPSPINPPSGCYFHTRCHEAMSICSEIAPESRMISQQHRCACHLYNEQK